MTTLVCYISGHGFGHASRVMEVLNALWLRRPDLTVTIRTPAARWIFDFNLLGRFDHAHSRLDVGAVQHDSLSVDPEGTLQAYADILTRKEALIGAEVNALARCRPHLVFADIPGLAFDIAARLGIPAVAMTNFSWDWIYADYVRDFPAYTNVVEDLRVSYAHATLLLRLPLHGDLSAFPRIRDIPFVARKARLTRADVRRRLCLPHDERIVLLSFGGIGVALRRAPAAPPGVSFISNQTPSSSPPPPWCRAIQTAAMAAAEVRYEDLVAASDAVITKPGYGIVAECIANGTPMVYTPRGRFAEYACLIPGIETHLPHALISNDDLYMGRWRQSLEAVFAQPRRTPDIDTCGAGVAADALLGLLGP
jgi:L-arabinokinase